MRAIYVPLIVLCGTLAASATLGLGGNLVLGGRLSLGVLSAFMTYALSLFQLFRQTATFISGMVSLQANVERVADLISRQPTVVDKPEVLERYGDCFAPKKENWESMRGEVEFDDVSFHYIEDGEEVLSHVSVKVPAGGTVALVGETGAGKSTMVNLVCRFFEPTGGRVLIERARRAGAQPALAAQPQSAMCSRSRICSPAPFARTSATAGRRRRTRRWKRRLAP